MQAEEKKMHSSITGKSMKDELHKHEKGSERIQELEYWKLE